VVSVAKLVWAEELAQANRQTKHFITSRQGLRQCDLRCITRIYFH
jgi:hypothetical protein